MGQDLSFACGCGQVHGTLSDMSPNAGGHLICHCSDCRRAVVWLGQPDPADGVAYFQTTPGRVHIDQGQDLLRAFEWKKPRLLRWYASCCNTPLFNTLDSPKWAFASIMIDRIKTAHRLALSRPTPLWPNQTAKPATRALACFL